MTRPTAIFFDFDETLAENQRPIQTLFTGLFEQHRETLGVDNQEAFFQFFRTAASGLWTELFSGTKSPEAKLSGLLSDCVKQLKVVSLSQAEQIGEQMFQQFLTDSAQNVRFNPNAEKILQTLRQRGYHTGIITNGIEAVQMAKINTLNLMDKVDQVTISAHAKAHKPLPEVFHFALNKSKLGAESSWMVGDHALNDVCGPQRVGMTGVYYNPNQLDVTEQFGQLDCQPTWVIADFIQLLDYLG